MPGPQYERTLSMESSDVGCDVVDFPAADRKQAERNIEVKRRAVILSIATIFSVTAIILVMSVVHVEMNKNHVGYQELVCQETDVECFKLMCPQGWGWVKEREECHILEGERSLLNVIDVLLIYCYHY